MIKMFLLDTNIVSLLEPVRVGCQGADPLVISQPRGQQARSFLVDADHTPDARTAIRTCFHNKLLEEVIRQMSSSTTLATWF